MKIYNYKGFEFYRGKNSYFIGNQEDGQIAPNDNVVPQTIAECKAVINSWLKVPETVKMKTEYRCKFCGKLLFKTTAPTKKTIYIVCPRCKKLNVM